MGSADRRFLLWDCERGAWMAAPGHGVGYTLDIAKARRHSQALAQRLAAEQVQPGEELIACPEPTGRVVLPIGIDSDMLEQLADGIDAQIALTGPVDSRIMRVRALIRPLSGD